jgi:hypothetical protein
VSQTEEPPGRTTQRGSRGGRIVAVIGISTGLISGVLCGVLAALSYGAWQSGRRERPLFAWFFACGWIAAALAAFVSGLLGTDWGDVSPGSPPVTIAVSAFLIGGGLGAAVLSRREHGDGEG